MVWSLPSTICGSGVHLVLISTLTDVDTTNWYALHLALCGGGSGAYLTNKLVDGA